MQAKVLTLDEERRVATNIARLPELLGKRDDDRGEYGFRLNGVSAPDWKHFPGLEAEPRNVR